MRQLVQDGVDPAVHIETQRIKKASIPTFAEAAEKVIELRAPTWSSNRHATQWRESLRLHALPRIGSTPVDAIQTADVLPVLMPIWNTKPETAGRVRQRMAVVFDFAIAAGWRQDNPCNGALKAALPRRTRQKQHHPALPYAEVGDAIRAVRNTTGRDAVKLGLEFLVLTASRAGEVRQATWDEIDVEAGVWTVPSEHMKMRRPHRVPLSTGALAVLEKAQEPTTHAGLVFPSNRTGRGALQHGIHHDATPGRVRPHHDSRIPREFSDMGLGTDGRALGRGGGRAGPQSRRRRSHGICQKRLVRAATRAHAAVVGLSWARRGRVLV